MLIAVGIARLTGESADFVGLILDQLVTTTVLPV